MNTRIMLSVIIPTFNPNIGVLNRVLDALSKQTLDVTSWELIIVDNNSSNKFHSKVDLKWQPNSRIVTEPKQGLTFARLKGFEIASGDIIVMVDDDNLLDKDYLEKSVRIMAAEKNLGAIGGKSHPVFTCPPPLWLKEFYKNLALRDLGDEIQISSWNDSYPESAPIGAGMVMRKAALYNYCDKILSSPNSISDRTGSSLSSSGDNDIILEILKCGFTVGYHPELELSHIIPPERMHIKYVAKLLNNTNTSWVKLLRHHQICPWNEISPWSLPFRKVKAYFTHAAWKGEANYIRWRGACGLYDGLSN